MISETVCAHDPYSKPNVFRIPASGNLCTESGTISRHGNGYRHRRGGAAVAVDLWEVPARRITGAVPRCRWAADRMQGALPATERRAVGADASQYGAGATIRSTGHCAEQAGSGCGVPVVAWPRSVPDRSRDESAVHRLDVPYLPGLGG